MTLGYINRSVLVSFSPSDRGWVDRFVEALRDRHLSVIPNELMLDSGEDRLSTIEAALRGADDLVFLVSGDPASQAWLFFEFGVASLSGKRFIPIVPDDLDLSRFPVPMQSRRSVIRRSPEQTAAELYDVEAATRTA